MLPFHFSIFAKETWSKVAVKVMRGISENQDVRRRFERVSLSELNILFRLKLHSQNLTELIAQWQRLELRNIMPCYGITLNLGPLPGMILPLCTNGAILKYTKKYPAVSKLDLVSQTVMSTSLT